LSVKNYIQRLKEELALLDTEAQGVLPQASVLICITTYTEEPSIILTKRADHMRLHPGEIAFPGGKVDATDRDRWHTALREAEEEIALPQHTVQQLGQMKTVITRSKIEVSPCVGLLAEPIQFVPNRDELDSVFTIPLVHLADESNLRMQMMRHRGDRRAVPSYVYEGYEVWGLTAALLVYVTNMACDAGLEMGR
jgi:8-oxo-dGTP pyrophosphatase MutT (NUDIX family)